MSEDEKVTESSGEPLTYRKSGRQESDTLPHVTLSECDMIHWHSANLVNPESSILGTFAPGPPSISPLGGVTPCTAEHLMH